MQNCWWKSTQWVGDKSGGDKVGLNPLTASLCSMQGVVSRAPPNHTLQLLPPHPFHVSNYCTACPCVALCALP